MRTGKSVTNSAGTTNAYTYVYENGQLLQMCMGSRIYDFSYDANGTPVSIAYRTRATATPTYYFYGVNSRGDVIALYNSGGTLVACYNYDAYGKLISVENANGVAITSATHVANMNPLRYRSYVYDTDTGFYYLQTRYYDPTTCRFINGDVYCSTGQGIVGNNMFPYCNNNPVVFNDPTGTRIFECCPYNNCSKCRKSSTNKIFGAEASTVTKIIIQEEELVFSPLSYLFTIKNGISTTKINNKFGDSTKPISVYAKGRADNPLLSSVGININTINDQTLTLNLSLDNIGLTGYRKIGDSTISFGYVADISQLKLGVEYGDSTQSKDLIKTNYTNVSITGKGLHALYSFCVYGQYIPTTIPYPSRVPAPN